MIAEFAAGLEDILGLQPITGGGDDNSGSPDSMSFKAVMDDFIFSYPDHDLYLPTTTTTPTVTRSDQTLTESRSLFFPAAVNYSGSGSSSSSSPSSSADSVSVSVQKQTTTTTTTNEAYVPKYKRRKNQQKRVMLQVTADDLSSDMWAWRKYGQKPIKGSPFPRSYYRCSSKKGCLAKRQLEQSCTDPSVFIVTYSGEHNHSQPTRKNALAGTIRHKFPHSKSPMSSSALAPPPRLVSGASTAVASSSSFSSSISSNTNKNNVDEATAEAKDDIVVKDEMDDHNHDDDNVLFSGMKLDDEFFSGLEDIDDLISELLNNTSPRP